jgi:hypothetical protein
MDSVLDSDRRKFLSAKVAHTACKIRKPILKITSLVLTGMNLSKNMMMKFKMGCQKYTLLGLDERHKLIPNL